MSFRQGAGNSGLHLDLQEYLFLVQEIEQEPPQHKYPYIENQVSCRFAWHKFHNSAEKQFGSEAEAYEFHGHIDGDGVHTYDLERECPFVVSLHVYYIIEEGEHKERVRAYYTGETAAPEVLVDREEYVPYETHC